MSFMVCPGGRVAGPPVNGIAWGMTSLQSVNCSTCINIQARVHDTTNCLTLDWTWPNKESLTTPELKAEANFDSLSLFKETDYNGFFWGDRNVTHWRTTARRSLLRSHEPTTKIYLSMYWVFIRWEYRNLDSRDGRIASELFREQMFRPLLAALLH